METNEINLLGDNVLTGVMSPSSISLANAMATLDMNSLPPPSERRELVMRRQDGLTAESLAPLLTKQLVRVDLSRNALGSIPPALANLSHLTHLNLAANALVDFPTVAILCQWPRLQVLDLSENAIQVLAADVPRALAHLVSLFLSGNALQSLPDSIDQWESLQCLQLGSERYGGNPLRALPSSVANMASLRRLEVPFCQLHSLPELNTRLEYLDVSHNQLCTLPASLFRHNAALTFINASYNRLQSVPPVDETDLEWLDVVNNELCILPESILRCVATVLVTGNPLTLSAAHGRTAAKEKLVWTHIVRQGCDDTSLDTALWRETFLSPGAELNMPSPTWVPTLREMAARRMLEDHTTEDDLPLPYAVLEYLQTHKRRCYVCRRPFVQEWMNAIHVKPHDGHPAVVTKIRLCSTDCWQRFCARWHMYDPPLPPARPPETPLDTWTLEWMVAAATASADQMQAERW